MRKQRLLIATHNRGKACEISALIGGLGYEVVSASDWLPPLAVAEEKFQTFAGNALLKARHYHSLTNCISLADDSGLVVDALGGTPGVHSARYAGPAATSDELIEKLLLNLAGVAWEQRTARFVCAMALVGDGVSEVFEAQCEGKIAFERRGANGFGFDPIFYDPQLERTFAELTSEEKALRSHRGKALEAVRAFLASQRA